MASDSCIANGRYKYIHDDHKDSIEAIDAHHVVVRTSNSRVFFVGLSALLLTATAVSLSLLKEKSFLILLWSLLLSALLVKLFLRKPVEKESIIIMSALGVQLETQYGRFGVLLKKESFWVQSFYFGYHFWLLEWQCLQKDLEIDSGGIGWNITCHLSMRPAHKIPQHY
ncbi:uncharacterized protein LOC130777928 isoform X2 [Actinidia eriantha]|uniref:uncharacterized protein LOC130777928 isoform X2 n=1 Tax=Actinidia eriantha TaxID=165200 RepID=UPI00258B58CA|nr:uncharacterized protein LOC130777928 isoform X2 [Actinidia eriantha]